jgi:hypothetical protein
MSGLGNLPWYFEGLFGGFAKLEKFVSDTN